MRILCKWCNEANSYASFLALCSISTIRVRCQWYQCAYYSHEINRLSIFLHKCFRCCAISICIVMTTYTLNNRIMEMIILVLIRLQFSYQYDSCSLVCNASVYGFINNQMKSGSFDMFALGLNFIQIMNFRLKWVNKYTRQYTHLEDRCMLVHNKLQSVCKRAHITGNIVSINWKFIQYGKSFLDEVKWYDMRFHRAHSFTVIWLWAWLLR